MAPLSRSCLAVAVATLAACGGSGSDPAPSPQAALSCDDSLKTSFSPDANTTVVAVKSFKKGDALLLTGASTPQTPKAANDVCMVKLNVGPGNPGPAGAPSTSPGIGIEVWLPAKTNWNNRVHNFGGGGWVGGLAGAPTVITGASAPFDSAAVAAVEGAVSSVTDTGHSSGDGTFAMNPDGTLNKTLLTDFASRGIHEQAVKTKALATAYFGSAPKYMYFEGGSTGGRQGLNLAQNNPADYDGIIANQPAINWSRFLTAEMYPQIVFQRDLGGTPLTRGQQDLVSNAAIAACDVVGGKHLGYIPDPSSCTYDPTTDTSVLCTADGGTNATAACVSKLQATAVNKLWYGMTTDGSVPSPATDIGWAEAYTPTLLGNGTHRWFGQPRGASLYWAAFDAFGANGLASPRGPFQTSIDQLPLELQNPAFGEPNFKNATGNGQSLWKSLSYVQLANAFDRGLALQAEFGNINTDNPDLSAFKNRGGKMLTWHGLADELIMPQGTINYYTRVAAQMGGFPSVQNFYRMYLVPGVGHATSNGTSNPLAVPPAFGPMQQYELLTNWVEKGVVPDQVTLQSTVGAVTNSRPVCVYPKKASYTSGDPTTAASYVCS